MKIISVTDIVDFRRKSSKSKQTFALNVKFGTDEDNTDGGGNYWIRSISAINKSYKLNDIQPVIDKRRELINLSQTADSLRKRTNCEDNIEILNTFEDMDFENLRPNSELTFKSKKKEHSLLVLKGVKVKMNPSHIFTFNMNKEENIGAIWFIAKKNGFSMPELGIYSDMLYKYLSARFGRAYPINTQYCIAVDLFHGSSVNYQQLTDRKIRKLLDQTIDELRGLMSFN